MIFSAGNNSATDTDNLTQTAILRSPTVMA